MTNFDNTTYSISDVATKIGISEKTLRRWEDAGRFVPARTIGNQRRYNMEDLQILDAIKHNVIPHQKDLLSLTLASQFLGSTEATLLRYVKEGKIQPFMTISHTYYPRHRLLPLLEEFKDKSPEPTLPPVNVELPPTSQIQSLTHTQKTPSLIPPSSTHRLLPYLIQFVITATLLTLYHLFFNQSQLPLTPTPSNSIQGAATNPSLRLLDDMLDPTTGGLTTTTLTSKLGTTTPNLTLLPGIPPTSPIPGSLYYDGSDSTLKLFANDSWQTITTLNELKALKFDLESKIATKSPTKP
ncbi:MAG: MerR family transcriptional regulator [Candidatus Moraniibacteriota bacterium]|nr:MAG: MerR family transcriptional regulator [Candidatus Moranbacteria bacterium]